MAKNLNIGNSSSPVHVNINEKLMIKSNVVPAISGGATTMGTTTVPTYVSDGLIVEASDKFAFWKDVSDSTTGVSVDDYLLRTGGTMIGPLALSADPTAAMQATTKNYVDSKITSAIGNYLPLSGGTLTGNLTVNGTTFACKNIQTSGDGIYFVGSNLTQRIVWFRDSTGDSYGNGIVVGNGGSTVIGAGESGPNLVSNLNLSAGDESLRLCADGSIYFYTNCDTITNKTTSCYINTSGRLMGAAWNDYAEYRSADSIEPGRCVIEKGDDTLTLSMERLQPGASIISDTFGFAIGETEKCKTPIAVSGRVLAYPFEDREEFKKNIGRPVCSGPNGTISIMTDEEYKEKGYCAIGTISAVPDYEEWGTGNVKIDGRVWIKVI